MDENKNGWMKEIKDKRKELKEKPKERNDKKDE